MKAVILFVSVVITVQSWKVLFSNPFAGGSHQTVSTYLANLLASRGHHVTYVSCLVPKALHKSIISRELETQTKFMRGTFASAPTQIENAQSLTEKVSLFFSQFGQISNFCDLFFKDDFVQNLIKSQQKFDVIIMMGLMETCSLGLAHKLQIPIKIMNMPAHGLLATHVYYLGIPVYPGKDGYDGLTAKTATEMEETPFVRVRSLFAATLTFYVYSLVNRFKFDVDVRKYVPDYPGYATAVREISLIYQHHSPLIDGPVPFGPGVVPLGGTLCTPYNYHDLGKELAEFLDGTSEGTIVVSFGSYSKTFSERELETLIAVFSRLPHKVVLKANPVPPNLPSNVKVFPWLPQQSLLQHPTVKLFITHGGYASKVEGLCAGVPLFVIPRFSPDQFETFMRISDRKLGNGIPKLNDTTVDELLGRVQSVLDDKELYKRVQKLSAQIKLTRTKDDQIMGYLDTAMSGYRLLPKFQPWWETSFMDVVLVPLATIWIIRVIYKRFIK